MFVTQKEIEARLASDDNLLNSLLSDSFSGRPSEKRVNEISPSLIIDSHLEDDFQEPDDETASANLSLSDSNGNGRYCGINDDDVKFQRILNESESFEYNDRGCGRPKGAADRSHEQRADIALMGTVLGHGLASDLLGVSTASSSLHSRGKVNHEDEIDYDLDRIVKRKLSKIRNKSADALMKVLDNAESASMYEQIKTAKDAVFVANGLASVIQKVRPEEKEEKPTAQFVIIQPTVRSVEQYEVINV